MAKMAPMAPKHSATKYPTPELVIPGYTRSLYEAENEQKRPGITKPRPNHGSMFKKVFIITRQSNISVVIMILHLSLSQGDTVTVTVAVSEPALLKAVRV